MIIYLIENVITNKIYIGQTVQNLQKRINQHKCSINNNSKGPPLLIASIRKHGFHNFRFHLIDTAKTQEELDKLETWYIEFFQSTNREIGYNIENGGHGTGKISEETKKKMSEASKGIPKSKQHCINNRLARLGKPLPIATRIKMSYLASIRNFEPRSKEYCDNISKGKKTTSDDIEKLILAEKSLTQYQLADKYGLTRNIVRRILKKR